MDLQRRYRYYRTRDWIKILTSKFTWNTHFWSHHMTLLYDFPRKCGPTARIDRLLCLDSNPYSIRYNILYYEGKGRYNILYYEGKGRYKLHADTMYIYSICTIIKYLLLYGPKVINRVFGCILNYKSRYRYDDKSGFTISVTLVSAGR